MSFPARRILHLAATLDGAAFRRLVAGVFLAAALSVTSCAEIVSSDAIDAYCNTACGASDAAALDSCATRVLGFEHGAEQASCGDAFLAFFRCEQQLPEDESDCGGGENCPDELSALAACENAHDPDNVCLQGAKHVDACVPGFAQQHPSPMVPCVGSTMCVLFCYQGATCEEISELLQGTGAGGALFRCNVACAFAQTNGTIGWLEDD